MPYDVIWLDIEHTDGKRYFTWDNRHFCHKESTENMIGNLVESGERKLVTIVDPHIKEDHNYSVYRELEARDLLMKKRMWQDVDENGEKVRMST